MPCNIEPLPRADPSAAPGALGVLRGLARRTSRRAGPWRSGAAAARTFWRLAAAYPRRVHRPGACTSAIGIAQECTRELGLDNVRFECGRRGRCRCGALGNCDYFLCHGVYSWIPDPSKQALLALASGMLAPQDFAYISYNAYPGCHFREMSRRMMRYQHPAPAKRRRARIAQGALS